MIYYYIVGLRVETKKWNGSKLDFVNYKTGNRYLDKLQALAELNDLTNKISKIWKD